MIDTFWCRAQTSPTCTNNNVIWLIFVLLQRPANLTYIINTKLSHRILVAQELYDLAFDVPIAAGLAITALNAE